MTDNTQPEAGSTHIIRLALELGLLWIDGDGRDKVREALDALDTLESQLEAIGAGGVSGPLVGRAALQSPGFDAADMATASAQGFRDGVASLSASAGEPSGHIKEPYTLAEIKAKIASNDYSAEMLLQHAMLLLDSASLAASVGEPLIARSRGEWHEDDGPVVWWSWNGHGWACESPWCGTPLDSDWPGYHTHWTPAPPAPTSAEGVEHG